jgi:hypothetical protein
MSGTVELKASGAGAYTAAKPGDIIRPDTVVSTGFKSSALIEVGSALINVRPLTRLTLTEISASSGAETINVNLQTGRVRVDVNPPAGTKASMSVTSPIATASVRGTSFEFDTRNLSVNNGTVSFTGNRGRPMQVHGGANSQVESNGRAADPIIIRNGVYRPAAPVGANSSGVGRTGSEKPIIEKHTPSGNINIELKY